MATLARALTTEAASAPPSLPWNHHQLATVLSPNQCSTFSDCSSMWWFRYGMNLPEPKNASLAMGLAVDQGLMTNFRQKIQTGTDLPVPDVVGAFDAEWKAIEKITVFRDDDDPTALAAKGRELVTLYMKEAARFIQPAAVQKRVEGVIGGVKVQGILDIVEQSGQIRDLKTSAKSPGEHVTARQKFQLATYSQLEPAASGLIQIDTLVKLKTPKLIRTPHKVSTADIRATEIQYPLFQDAMRAGYYTPNRSSYLCSRKNCAFWRECEKEYGGTVTGGDE